MSFSLAIVNRICYAIAIVCIIAAVTIAIGLIWGNWDDTAIKALCTLAVIWAGSALTLAINRTVHGLLGGEPRAMGCGCAKHASRAS